MQFVADNVDHNVKSLTSHDTLQAMGITAVSVLKQGDFGTVATRIPRVKGYVKVEDLCKNRSVEILQYSKESGSGLMTRTPEPHLSLQATYCLASHG
jgi:hypothetical protein